MRHQSATNSVQSLQIELFGSFQRDEAHSWPLDGFGNRFSIAVIVLVSFEVAAAEMTLFLHVADEGFDGGSSSDFAFDDAEHAALLA